MNRWNVSARIISVVARGERDDGSRRRAREGATARVGGDELGLEPVEHGHG